VEDRGPSLLDKTTEAEESHQNENEEFVHLPRQSRATRGLKSPENTTPKQQEKPLRRTDLCSAGPKRLSEGGSAKKWIKVIYLTD